MTIEGKTSLCLVVCSFKELLTPAVLDMQSLITEQLKCLKGNFTGETDNWFKIAVAEEEYPGRLLFSLEAAATYPLFYTKVVFW